VVTNHGTALRNGAYNDEGPNGSGEGYLSGAGSAYVFDSSGGAWTQQTKLAADDGNREDNFGISVAASRDGTTAVIGAFEDQEQTAMMLAQRTCSSECDWPWVAGHRDSCPKVRDIPLTHNSPDSTTER